MALDCTLAPVALRAIAFRQSQASEDYEDHTKNVNRRDNASNCIRPLHFHYRMENSGAYADGGPSCQRSQSLSNIIFPHTFRAVGYNINNEGVQRMRNFQR